MKTKFLAVLAFLLTLATLVRADGLIIIRNPPRIVGPVRHYVFAPLEVAFHKVDVSIDG